jgi:tight adherence protein B
MVVVIIAILGFVTLAGLGLAFAGPGEGAKVAKRAQSIVSGGPREVRAANAKSKSAVTNADNRRKQIVKGLKEQEKQQKKQTVTTEARLHQAGLSLTVRNFWVISAVLALGTFGLVIALDQKPWIGLALGLAAGFGLPRWVIGFLGKRRTKKFTEAFSDAIDIIVRGIKSGLPVHDCLKIIGKESPEPVAGEFRRLVENVGMGLPLDASLEKMFARMPTPEVRFFAIVIAIQAKTGGNLAEALNNLSTVLRGRKMMREKIKALSSEAIASSFIIGSLPPGVVILIMVTTPGYMAPMFSDPRGHLMLLGAVFWMALGIFVMRRMINFKF